MTSIQLTAKQTALMQAIADGGIDFFRDGGLNAGANCWSNVLTSWLAGSTQYAVSATETGVSSVAKSLCRKGLLETDGAGDEASYYLTEAGAEVARELHGEEAEAFQAEVDATIADSEALLAAKAVPVHEDTETYTTNEWTEGDAQWTETIFNDGSYTLRRHRQVSGAWRTDFWGKEAGAEKKALTTSAKAKAARVNGTFTR